MVGALQHYGAARADQTQRSFQPAGRSADFNHYREGLRFNVFDAQGRNAPALKHAGLFFVPDKDRHIRAHQFQHLNNEEAQFSCANDQHRRTRLNVNRLGDLQGRSKRLGEYGRVVAHAVRHNMKVSKRQAEIIGKCARIVVDAQCVACQTLAGNAKTTQPAVATTDVDFTCNPSAAP